MSLKDATPSKPPNQPQKCPLKLQSHVHPLQILKVKVRKFSLLITKLWQFIKKNNSTMPCVADFDAGDEVDLCLVTRASAHFNKLMEQFNCLMKIHTSKDANFQVELSKVIFIYKFGNEKLL
jgi:hypothetical protein